MEYPYQRNWSIKSIDIERYAPIKNSWNHSKEKIEEIRALLDATNDWQHKVSTIVTAGSLARMEASADVSDADLIIVLNNDIELNTEESKNIYEEVWSTLNPLNLQRPKPTGLFSVPTNSTALLDQVGNASESYNIFGKRLLLLLESQPLWNNDGYRDLITNIVDRYAKQYVKDNSNKEWTLLINDLIRYFRSLAVNYQWDFNNEFGKWAIRNVKLRHSRLVMYSGLLFLLGEASKERVDKVGQLKKNLKLTPLERLAYVYEENKDWNFFRIMGSYSFFLSRMSQTQVRDSLNYDLEDLKTNPYTNRYSNEEFSNLKSNSDGLIAELLRFILSRRGDWTERFFEYLIF